MNDKASPLSPGRGRASKAARILTAGLSDTPKGRFLLRRAVLLAIKMVLRLRSSPFFSENIVSALVIAPHQDDEALGCGGTAALIARKQVPLDLAFVTDGSASHPKHAAVSPSEMARRRRDEAREATGILGIEWKRVTFLDVSDGTLSQLDEHQVMELEDRIAELLKSLSPDAILLPCRRDGSSEHDASFARVVSALKKTGLKVRVLEFPVWSWWNPLLLLAPIISCQKIWRVNIRPVRGLKSRAIASYTSQIQAIPPDTEPALPLGFTTMFLGGDEYLFEW